VLLLPLCLESCLTKIHRLVGVLNREVVLSLVKKLLVHLTHRLLRDLRSNAHLSLFGFRLMHIHNHLEIIELLRFPQVIDGVNKRLLSHCHNLLADVLDDIIFKNQIVIVWQLDHLRRILTLTHEVGHMVLLRLFAIEILEKCKILLVDSILFLLNGFDDLRLGLTVSGATFTVARNVGRVVLLAPLCLSHRYPSLRLRLNSDRGNGHSVHKCSSIDLSRLPCDRRVSLELFKTSHTFKLFGR